jgi:hypothetical protein
MARHFWGGVEPLGDRGATPLGRGAAASFIYNSLIFESYPQVLSIFNKDLSCFYRSFLFLGALKALCANGFRAHRWTDLR